MDERYTIRMGDCIELMRELPENSVDMVLTDPPYGTTRCKWDAMVPFEPMWEQIRRVVKPDGAVVLFSAEPFTSALVMSNPREFRYDLIWQKDRGVDFLNANRKPLRIHENIVVFYRRKPVYNKQFGEGKPYKAVTGKKSPVWGEYKPGHITCSDGKRMPTTLLKFNQERGLHPTQKPVTLLEWLIKTYTNPGETVLDFCMGSGSTGVACRNTGRRFIGFELDGSYFETASNRLADGLWLDVDEVTQ